MPAALVLGVAALWFARSKGVRAAVTLWLGWLVITTLTFSFMAGIFHAYYTVALAPAIGALVAIGGHTLWRARESLAASAVLAFATAFTASLAFVLLDRAGDWYPWLKYAVAALGLVAALLIAGVRHLPVRLAHAVAAAALVTALAGPTAYSLSTAATPHTGSIPSAGMGGGTGGGVGGLLNGSESTAALTALLQEDAAAYTWTAGRSAASTGRTRARRSRSSSSTSPTATSTGSSPVAAVPMRVGAQATRSPPGWPRTSPHRPSTA
jgi:hypothetical protein